MPLTFATQLLPGPEVDLSHSWGDPGHYLFCNRCRIYRSFHVKKAEELAAKEARFLASSEQAEYHDRRIVLRLVAVSRVLHPFLLPTWLPPRLR